MRDRTLGKNVFKKLKNFAECQRQGTRQKICLPSV